MDFGREINLLYIHELLRNLGISIIGIFIPVYIVSEGFPIYYAGLFIILSGTVSLLCSYPLAKFISGFGFKHSLIASYLLTIPGLAIIQTVNLSLSVILVSAVLYNLGRVTHGICLKSEFAVESDDDSRDKDSGRMLSIPNISRVVAPLLGGTIFAVLGFSQLLLISITILAISILPLIMTKDHRDPFDYDIKSMISQDYISVVPLFTIRGIQSTSGVAIFGLFIYYLIGGTIDVGGARALDSLGFTITGLVTGRLIQKHGRSNILVLGAIGAAIAHSLRGFVATPTQVFILSMTAGIFFQIYHVPLYSRFAELAEEEDILEFYTIRRMFSGIGNILTILTLIASYFFLGLSQAFIVTFMLASFSTLFMAYQYQKIR